jgi:transmembrane sensor
MEESVNTQNGPAGLAGLAEMMRDVALEQRGLLAGAHVLGQVRARGPVPTVKGSFSTRFMRGLPRMRFVLPTLAAVGALALWWTSQPAPLSFAVGNSKGDFEGRGTAGAVGDKLEAPANQGLPLRFSDGSLVALNAGARVRITALDGHGAILQLEKGRVDVSVHHVRHTRWQLRAGGFEVTVTGTRFSLDWEDKSGALTLVMTEGSVEVRGHNFASDSPITVTAGQRFHATAGQPRWTLASTNEPTSNFQGPIPTVAANPTAATTAATTAPSNTDPPSPSESPAAPSSSVTRTGAIVAVSPRSWQSLARSGRYQEALSIAERAGFDKACHKLGAEDLVQLGDVARLARNAPRAEQAYQMARRRFPRIDRPAFELGLVAFEQRRDFRAAGKWFDIYVRQYPNGQLAHEAVGRAMESWHRAGDAGRARRAAHDYLNQDPTGPYAPLARQIAVP